MANTYRDLLHRKKLNEKLLLPGNDKEECDTKCENRKDLMKHLVKDHRVEHNTTCKLLSAFSYGGEEHCFVCTQLTDVQKHQSALYPALYSRPGVIE